MRVLMRIITTTLLIVIIGVGGLLSDRPSVADACTQPIGGHVRYTIPQHVERADVVIVGTVISEIEGQPYLSLLPVTIQVETYLKGEGPSVLAVSGYGDGALCLSPAQVGYRAIFWIEIDAGGNYRASYGSAHDATLSATDENIAAIEAITGPGRPAPDDGLFAEIVEGTAVARLTATADWFGTRRASTDMARNQTRDTAVPDQVKPTTTPDTSPESNRATPDLLMPLLLCLSAFFGPMLVLVVQIRRRTPML